MQAVISGSANVALMIDGERLSSIHADNMEETVARRPGDFRYLFGDAQDLEFLEDVDDAEIRARLETAHDAEEALHLTLFLFDSDLPTDVRQDAAGELDGLLSKIPVARQLENVLYAQPLPESADLAGAQDSCEGDDRKLAREFIRNFLDRQAAIRDVRLAWDQIPTSLMEAGESRSRIESVFVREGLFRGLVLNRVGGDTVDKFLFGCLLNPRLKSFANHREIAQTWTEPFREARKAADQSRTKETRVKDHEPRSRSRGKQRRLGIDRKKALASVETQKTAIVAAMEQRDFGRVARYLEDLIEYQREHGGVTYACKSLCDLATEAKLHGHVQLQLELTERSVGLKPDDAWSQRQYADALLNMGKPREALAAYDAALSIREDDVAKRGRAETLKALNRLEEARSVYEQIIAQHPEDVVAKNGRAGTLKALNLLEEARAAYEQIIAQHPEDVFAKTGRAETLKALNLLEEARAAYEQIIAQHPENVFAKTGRAETLKALNQLEEARTAYEQIVAQHPENVVAKNGLAMVLTVLECWDEAKALLPRRDPATPGEWIGYHIRGMILLRTGEVGGAIEIFEEGVRSDPRPASRDYFRTALALGRMRQAQHEVATQVLAEIDTPTVRVRAAYLKLHAAGELHDFDGAREALRKLPGKAPPVVQELRDELQPRYIDRQEPGHSDEWCFQRHVTALLLAA